MLDIPVTEEELREYPGIDYDAARSGAPPAGALGSRLSSLDKRENSMQFTREDVESQVNKILSSQYFERCRKIGVPFRAVVRMALQNLPPMTEYEIATSCLGKPSSFDSRVDTTVRVYFNRIRQKLAEYYAAEGKDDAIVISFPQHYEPHFTPRGAQAHPALRRAEAAIVERCCAILEPSYAEAAAALRREMLPSAEVMPVREGVNG